MPFVDALLSPIGFGLAVALVLWRLGPRLHRVLRRFGIAILVVCLALSTPLGANALVSIQESRTPPPGACLAPPPDAIVVLSGGARRLPRDAGDYDALSASSLRRTLVAVDLMHASPGATLVVTGRGRHEVVAQAEVMAALARRFGVDGDAIRVEPLALTTWENAGLVRAMHPELSTRIWLVTAASHMPRALLAFRRAGFEPCSYPADSLQSSFEGVADFLPSGRAAANSEAILHEWIGEIVYRFRS